MIVAIDETPVGVFVEIEGSERGIETAAAALGRTTADYIVDSYRGLFLQERERLGTTGGRHDVRRVCMSGPRALVLTAGLGTRLQPLTYLRAKAAVPVNGETLARRAVRWLVSQGVADLVLNLHHRPETITASVGDGSDMSARVRYSWEQPLLGSAGGPRHALPLLIDAAPVQSPEAAATLASEISESRVPPIPSPGSSRPAIPSPEFPNPESRIPSPDFFTS